MPKTGLILETMKTTFCKQVYFDGRRIEIPAHGLNIAPIIKAAEKHGGYLTVTLQTPQRPRTTGERSQNHFINGAIQQICKETGNDFNDVKMYVKRKAFRRGYPMKRGENGNIIYSLIDGQPIPESEAKISTVEAGYLIEEIIQLAAELEIVLEGV